MENDDRKKYEVNIFGWGREIVMGVINPKTYAYFEKNKIDLSEWVNGWEDHQEIPQEIQPFLPGEWTECDDILHARGASVYPQRFYSYRA